MNITGTYTDNRTWNPFDSLNVLTTSICSSLVKQSIGTECYVLMLCLLKILSYGEESPSLGLKYVIRILGSKCPKVSFEPLISSAAEQSTVKNKSGIELCHTWTRFHVIRLLLARLLQQLMCLSKVSSLTAFNASRTTVHPYRLSHDLEIMRFLFAVKWFLHLEQLYLRTATIFRASSREVNQRQIKYQLLHGCLLTTSCA